MQELMKKCISLDPGNSYFQSQLNASPPAIRRPPCLRLLSSRSAELAANACADSNRDIELIFC